MNIDKTEFLTTKAFKLFSTLSKWDIKGSMGLRAKAEEEEGSDESDDSHNSFDGDQEGKIESD